MGGVLTRVDMNDARWQLRDEVLLKLNNLLSRVAIGNELLIERLFGLLFVP